MRGRGRAGRSASRLRPAPRALAFCAGLVCLAVALPGQDENGRFPTLATPPPIPPTLLLPIREPIRLTIDEARFTIAPATRVRMARLELVANVPERAAREMHASLLRVTGLGVITAPPAAHRPGSRGKPAATIFRALPGPRIAIDRLVLEDASAGALDAAGGWAWRSRDLQLDARAVQVGGGQTESLRLARLSFDGEFNGATLRVAGAAGTVGRTATRLDTDARVSLGTSRLTVRGHLLRSGAYHATLAALPLALAEVNGLEPRLPDRGTAAIDMTIDGDGGGARIAIERARAGIGGGVVTAHGVLCTGENAAVQGLVVEVRDLAPVQRDATSFGHSDGAQRWDGAIHANGGFRDGVRVDARFTPAQGDALRDRTRLAVTGSLWLEPRVALDLAWTATEVRVEASDSIAILVDAAVQAAGPADAVRIDGRLAAKRDTAAARFANGMSGPREAHAAVASVRGLLVLAGDRAIDVNLRADSIPLDLLPAPASADSVHGYVRAEARVSGPLGRPGIAGTMEVRGGGFHVPSMSLAVSELNGTIRFDERAAVIDRMNAVLNEGTIRVAGRVTLAPPRALDIRMNAGGVRLGALDSPRVLAFVEAAVTGPVGRPEATVEARASAFPDGRGDTVALATARGRATLAEDGVIDVRVAADSVPLDLWRVLDSVREVHGTGRGEMRLSGTFGRPRVDGEMIVHDAGMRIVRTGMQLSETNGRIRIEDGLANVETMRARAGHGTISVNGQLRVANGPRTMDVALAADSATVVDTDSAQVIASARLSATGPLELPTVRGTIALLNGRVHEDNFARVPVIDVDAPPYADLVRRVPWIRDSRLRRGATEQPPRFRARIRAQIHPGLVLFDEDSELAGRGSILIIADSNGINADGLFRVETGYFVQYGKVLRIVGGGFLFTGDGFAPRVLLHSEQMLDEPLGTGLGSGLRPLDEFPPVESFARGTATGRVDETKRLSLLPEPGTALAAKLLYNAEPEPVTGYRAAPFYAPDDGADLIGERAETQTAAMLWAYFANELYDWIPLRRGFLRAGAISVASTYPGRTIVAPFITSALRAGPFEARLTQALGGGAPVGVRLQYAFGALEVAAFNEPWFLATLAEGGGRGFIVRQRAGLGVRWAASY